MEKRRSSNGIGHGPSPLGHLFSSVHPDGEQWKPPACQFEAILRSSHRFFWAGLVEGKDEAQRTRVGVFLVEAPRHSERGRRAAESIDIQPAFTTLAMTLRPTIFLELHYLTDPGATEEEWRRQATQAGAETYQDAQFIGDVSLGSPALLAASA